MTNPASPLLVVPVESRADLRRFIDLPWSIYRGDPNWVPPLKRDVRAAFDPTKHPFHLHSEVQPYLALRGRDVVGRICAIRNRNHEAIHEESVGFFGWFECIDDPEAAEALFDAVRGWLRGRGLTALRGPTSFSTNETTGLLIDGDPRPPVLLMAHNPPWYPALLEGCGLRKVKDLYCWNILEGAWPEHLFRAEKLVTRRYGTRIRTLDMSKFDEELLLIRRIYNAAWEKNWGFVPMTDAEMDHMAAELKPIIDPDLALFAETPDGEAIGFTLALPDFNQVLHKLNGRLTPLGLLKALYYKRKVTCLRVLILGLMEEWRGKGIDVLLYLAIFRNGTAAGMNEADMSWILEDNRKMNAGIERLGARMYRTYRLYEAPL
ncbi:N-acetyltransferase [Candidatus Palauibacter sp.]|uniref:N-acetyltransferase n=1 Tax=Candidatus Palauibacter sp. TaxID=3101350 RepID=UPI003B010252